MTLEEAKKEIEERGDDAWKKWKKEGNLISQGYALGMDDALGIVDKLDTESSGKPEQLTLKELAHEMGKIFRFKYLTVSPDFCGCPSLIYCWNIRPAYHTEGRMWLTSMEGAPAIVTHLEAWYLEMDLDLSKYKDADGNIDYPKCIVEVK